MKIEDQVCSLEQAKRLVELGVVLDTKIVWLVAENHNPDQKPVCLDYKHWSYNSCYDDYISIPAPNVAELGVLLGLNTGFYMLRFGKKATAEFRQKWCDYDECAAEIWNKPTEAQARAEALIWLIENDYIKVENLKL